MSSSHVISMPTLPSNGNEAPTPAPRCVLCLCRSPSAVLLPCAHLVMCHLCAPAFMLRSAPSQPEPETVEVSSTKSSWQETVRRASASLERSPELKRRLLGLMPSSEDVIEDEEGYLETLVPRESLAHKIRSASSSHPSAQHRASDAHAQRGRIASTELATRFQAMQVNNQINLTTLGDVQARCVVCRAGVTGWLRVYGA